MVAGGKRSAATGSPTDQHGAPRRGAGRRRTRCGVFFLFLFLGACGGERLEQTPHPASVDTPIILISIDTLRSDRLPAYGYGSGSTPSIDRFRRDSILFNSAFSHCPLTLPSHASVLTGLMPAEHGIRDNVGYVLTPKHPTLATRLRASGYATGAAVSSYVLRRSTGIGEGFDFFDDSLEYEKALIRTIAQRDGEKARLALEGWLDGIRSRKVLAFLHLYEPHAPYSPPPAFARKSGSAYDGEVSYADDIVGRFLESLKKRGLYDHALIILFSDHGEGLGDHGEDEHGVFLYRESLQVPLIVKLPGGRAKGSANGAVTALVDVMPMVLAAAGLKQEVVSSNGVDVLNIVPPADRHVESETYYPRLHFGWHELRSSIDARFHFIDAPAKELYEYRKDAGEKDNILGSNRRIAFAMDQRIATSPANFEPPGSIDPEDQRKLASLGYLGSTATASGALPDPKTKVAALRQIRLGFDLVSRREYASAVQHLRSFTKENPDVIDGWWLLGQSLAKTGREEEGLRALKEAARRFPSNSSILLATADLLFSMKRYEEAHAHALLATRDEPVLAREFLARMEMKRTRFSAAEEHLRSALRESPHRTETMMLLADALRAQNRRSEELPVLDGAEQQIRQRHLPPIENLQFFRGEALLSVRRVADAEKAFRAETQHFPENRKAWASLALVVGAQGRRSEAREILINALRRNPDKGMEKLAVESLSVMGDRDGVREIRRLNISSSGNPGDMREMEKQSIP